MNQVIKVTNLNKSFEDNHVLKDISFEVNQGDVVAEIGRASCRERV